jgi:hypothetical protein
VVVTECKTWYTALKEEHRLSAFVNRVLRRIFGPKGDEATGAWRKLHYEFLILYFLPSRITNDEVKEIR